MQRRAEVNNGGIKATKKETKTGIQKWGGVERVEGRWLSGRGAHLSTLGSLRLSYLLLTGIWSAPRVRTTGHRHSRVSVICRLRHATGMKSSSLGYSSMGERVPLVSTTVCTHTPPATLRKTVQAHGRNNFESTTL